MVINPATIDPLLLLYLHYHFVSDRSNPPRLVFTAIYAQGSVQ